MTLDPRPSIVIGTRNRKKGVELAELLAPFGFAVMTLDDFPSAIDVVEDGDTFAANAALKATLQAKHIGHWVLADDSGLEVDALAGRPGVYSARYSQMPPANQGAWCESPATLQTTTDVGDDANNRRLLKELGSLPLEKRTARYVCHVTVADPTGTIRAESHDECRGRIRFLSAGTNGFGYDPLFEVVEYHSTFGELGPHVKRAISHRSRALRAILPELLTLSRQM